MITYTSIYILCSFLMFMLLYINLRFNLIMEPDPDLQNILNNKVLTYIILTILSLLWIITLPITVIINYNKKEG